MFVSKVKGMNKRRGIRQDEAPPCGVVSRLKLMNKNLCLLPFFTVNYITRSRKPSLSANFKCISLAFQLLYL